MEPEDIIECVKHAINFRLKIIVLQSGEDKSFEVNELCKIVREIKNIDVAVIPSIGELSKIEYAVLKYAGADRYPLRIETSNEQLYKRFHLGMSYKNRVRCLYYLKELGYETGIGCLIGLRARLLKCWQMT